MNAATSEVLLVPHLPLGEPARFGQWVLGPADVHTWVDDSLRAAVELLLTKYDPAASPPTVVARESEPIGAVGRYDDVHVRALQAALDLTGINGNPDVHESGWAAHRAVSSDNLAIEGRLINADEGWFSTQEGTLIQHRVGGLRLDDPHSRIAVPLEVRHPEPVVLDDELGTAVLEYLESSRSSDGSVPPQRMQTALDWFSLAWRNTASVGFAPRIVFLRTAFEALIPGKTSAISARLVSHFESFARAGEIVLDRPLDQLLWSPTEQPVHASGGEGSPLSTDLEEWFRVFSDLRNRIVHEGLTALDSYDGPAERYRGDFFWIAERLFREVVRTQLTISGYGDVWMDPVARTIHRHAVAWLAAQEPENGG